MRRIYFHIFSILTGDIKFIATATCHQGAAALYPCPFCYEKDMMSRNKSPPRTLKDWTEDALTLKNDIKKELSKKGKSLLEDDVRGEMLTLTKKYAYVFQKNRSIFGEPILHIELINICPPPLHIISGVLDHLLKIVEFIDKEK